MIRISNQIDLTAAEEADGVNGNNPRIGWHSIVTTASVAADDEDPDWPVTNLGNQATHLYWQAVNLGNTRVYAATGGESVNYLAVAAHNLRMATVQVQTSTNASLWTDLDDSVLLQDNSPFVIEFPDTVANYIGLRITPFYEIPAMACLNIGRILRLQRRIYVGHRPMPLNRQTEVSTGRSESGAFLGRVKRRQSQQTEVVLNNLTPDWYRDNIDPFAEFAETGAFFWAWRPESYPNEVAFAWLTDDLVPVNERGNGMMNVNLPMAGIGTLLTGGADAS